MCRKEEIILGFIRIDQLCYSRYFT